MENLINSTNISSLNNVDDLSNIGATISSYYYSTFTSVDVVCSQDSHCLNGGKCNKDKNSCTCSNGCWGTNCNFTKDTATKAAAMNDQILDKFNSMDINSSNQTQNLKIASTLEQMTSVPEINSESTVNKTFDLISKLAGNNTSVAVASSAVNTVSNLLEIVTTNSSGDSKKREAQIDKVKDSVELIINSQLSSNKTVSFTSGNIVIKAIKLDTSNKTQMAETLKNVFSSNSLSDNSSNSNSSSIVVNDAFIEILSHMNSVSAQKTEWASNIYSTKDPNIIISSGVVSFDVKGENNSKVEIKNLSSPIQIQIAQKNKIEDNQEIKCKFFNTTTNKWEENGMELSVNSSYVCKSSHLTDFATSVILKGISSSDNYTLKNNYGIYASIIYFMLCFLICLSLLFVNFPTKNKMEIERDMPETISMNVGSAEDLNKEVTKQQKQEKKVSLTSFKMLSPIYSLLFSKSYEECSKKLANFIIYLTTISMFLACLYSSPDYDVFNLNLITLLIF